MKHKSLTLYLDWTPNINHIGFFVAKDLGFYEDLEIGINLLDPSIDNYKVTPAKKVELGESNFALCPFESVISYRRKALNASSLIIVNIRFSSHSLYVLSLDSPLVSPVISSILLTRLCLYPHFQHWLICLICVVREEGLVGNSSSRMWEARMYLLRSYVDFDHK